MASDFYMDRRGLEKLEKFFKDAPKLIKPVTANILTSLAFKTREYDIQNLTASLIIRDKKILKSIMVDKAKSGPIESQISRVYSINRGTSRRGGPTFTGWQEQQTGKANPKKTVPTMAARGGNKRNIIKPKYRLLAGRKHYTPEQFSARSAHASFMFMLRIIGNKGGDFLLKKLVPTKRGTLGRGLYNITGHKITRYQSFESAKQPRRIEWRTQSLRQLMSGNNMDKIWRDSMTRIMRRYK